MTRGTSIAKMPQIEVHIPYSTWIKMMTYVQLCKMEINGFGMVTRIGNTFYVSDVFITDQEVSSVHAETDGIALAHHIEEMVRAGVDLSLVRFQWHSHVNMTAQFSPIDTGTMDRYENVDWWVSLVVNKRGEATCRVDLFSPLRVGFEVVPHIVIPGPTRALVDECAENILEKVRILRAVVMPESVLVIGRKSKHGSVVVTDLSDDGDDEEPLVRTYIQAPEISEADLALEASRTFLIQVGVS